MNTSLEIKLKSLPRSPGVYFHKSKNGEIIYVGKAAVLKNRVRQYFQSSRGFDLKTQALIREIYDVDWVETESEIDALFLESEMVKRYMPRYNIELRDDKSQLYIRIDMKSEWPYVCFTRNPADDGAEYFGPFYNGLPVKKALRHLRKVYPYFTKPPENRRGSRLEEELGLNPRREDGAVVYKQNLRKLISYIKGNRKALTHELETKMREAAKNHDFESAAMYRNKLSHMKELQRRVMFGDTEFLDISKDQALADLVELLGLERTPKRIEGYDISHMGGTNVVASMVVFTNGASDRAEYRKFKTKIEHNDDFYNMNETIQRRFSQKNIASWGEPDLVLIDGGKGQLEAAVRARDARNSRTPFIGIAKKQEQLVVHVDRSNVTLNISMIEKLGGFQTKSEQFILINLPHSSHIIKLLQRIRDESHRFAVSYHTVLKRKKQTDTMLEEIPGIGPATRKKLIKEFGSLRALQTNASKNEIAKAVGAVKAEMIVKYIQKK